MQIAIASSLGQLTGHTVAVLAQFEPHFFDVEQHLPSMVQQGFTGRRQGHAFRLAHEQADAQRFLQLRQPLAGRRHSDGFMRGGTGLCALLMNGDKQLESDQVEAADQAFLQHGRARCLGSAEPAGYPGSKAISPQHHEASPYT